MALPCEEKVKVESPSEERLKAKAGEEIGIEAPKDDHVGERRDSVSVGTDPIALNHLTSDAGRAKLQSQKTKAFEKRQLELA